jgi:hypothetical protein
MISQETLERVRKAFDRVRREGDLRGWSLEDKFVSLFLQESGSDELTVSLLRGDAGRTSIELDLSGTPAPDDAAYVSELAAEIMRALREKNIFSKALKSVAAALLSVGLGAVTGWAREPIPGFKAAPHLF